MSFLRVPVARGSGGWFLAARSCRQETGQPANRRTVKTAQYEIALFLIERTAILG
jgi:hypothetical protein